ncbi:MAG TPA: M23 family metallopeptidase [Thermoanaerobacterales bacterium]|jgi:murein DD-endopeptidase|nr:M23 family metallopeptidase [Thermoanaerobacterales bacterium]
MYYYEQPSEKKWFGPENLKKVIICIVIIIIILLMKKINIPIVKAALGKINYFVSDYSYEFKDVVEAINEMTKVSYSIPVLSQKEQELLPMPVNGEVSSEYGMRFHPILKEQRMHNGIDIVQKEGLPVKTVLDGVVLSVGQDKEMGNVVKIRHNSGLITVYAHLKHIYVKEQEVVKQGFIIGTVGKTGLAQTPHLHFEIWLNDKPEDPRKWLNLSDDAREDLNGFKSL